MTRYGRLGASSRVRFFNFFEILISNGINIISNELISNQKLKTLYDKGEYNLLDLVSTYLKRFYFLYVNRNCKVLWLEKELLPWLPFKIEFFFLKEKHLILDIDDAIFHKYDQHPFWLIRKLFGKKIDKLMEKSNVVFAGSPYLAERAKKSGAVNIISVPTSVDTNKYQPKKSNFLKKIKLLR